MMRACLVIILSLLGDFIQAAEVSVDEVLPVISANSERSVSQLRMLQAQALKTYRTAAAYQNILREGLSSDHKEYKRSTCDLLLETFDEYLLYDPRPTLDDVLKLLKPNGSFFVSELISFKRILLSKYPSWEDYKEILKDGVESTHAEYKSETGHLIAETFVGYLQKKPKPNLSDALSIVRPNRIFSANELMAFAIALLAAYKEPENLVPILEKGLLSEHLEYQSATKALALEKVYNYIKKSKVDADWHWLKEIIELAARTGFSAELNDQIDRAYRTLLKSEKSDEELLALSAAVTKLHDLKLFVRLKTMHLKARPQARDLLLADCFSFEGIQARNCVTLVSPFNRRQSISETYKTLADLRLGGHTDAHRYKQYRNHFEDKALERLRNEVQEYLGEAKILGKEKIIFNDAEVPKECPICLDERPKEQMHILWQCHHALCQECLKAHITSELEQSKPVLCTDRDCQCPLSSNDFTALHMRGALHQSIKNELRAVIAGIPEARFCNNGQCPDAVIPDRSAVNLAKKKTPIDLHYTCRTCATMQCAECTYVHVGKSCKQFQKELKHMQKKAESFDKRIYKRKHHAYKPCPNCKVIIEKDQGCDHMTCKRCTYEFYWSNGRPYRRLS